MADLIIEGEPCVICKYGGCKYDEARAGRDRAVAALRAVWGDMRGMDKHHVPNDVLALVRGVIGPELDKHDPAAAPRNQQRTEDTDG